MHLQNVRERNTVWMFETMRSSIHCTLAEPRDLLPWRVATLARLQRLHAKSNDQQQHAFPSQVDATLSLHPDIEQARSRDCQYGTNEAIKTTRG
jgi:hypothetical protein